MRCFRIMGFKNLAADRARHDWVLSLDSDETIPPALAAEIDQLALDDPGAVYILKRDNYFLGKRVRHGGWGRDRLVRLYNRTRHRFDDALVHERVEPRSDAAAILLAHSFRHDAVRDIDQLLHKVIRYSDLAAADRTTRSFLVVLAAAHFAFFRSYVLQLGFLEGWRGVVIAVSDFNGRFFRYMKRYLNCGRK
ncbi:MAG: glycosyltransferase family 2 protein [Thioalkalivibrio sp.]|nr:glycosyltransferase family 2 protein [Thioalkalivibrio sp.]